MGIIKTQSIKSGIYTYIGVFLGFINSTLLIPNLLSTTEWGILSTLNAVTGIFAAAFTFGIPLITIKLFPHFRNNDRYHYFFSFSLFLTSVGILLGVLGYVLFQDYLLTEKNTARNFAPFLYGFIILFAAKLMSKNFDVFNRMLYKTVLGSFLENFFIKILITLLLLVFWKIWNLDFVVFFYLYITALATPGIIQFAYIIFSGNFNFNLSKFWSFGKQYTSEIKSLSVYGLLGTLGTIIVLEVDKLMISNMISVEETAIYTTCFFFGLFINIPSRGLKRVTQAIVSDLWKSNNIDDIRTIYRKTCINQLLISLYLFLGVWLNIDYVFQFIPEEYSAGKYVILIIGFGQLADMITGANSEIIAGSEHYRYNTYFTGSLIILVVLFNWLLIPKFGIEGAALASALSMFAVNSVKFFFLNRKLKFQPFNKAIVQTFVIGFLSWLAMYSLLPVFTNPFIGILITGGILTIIYWVPSYFLAISGDINSLINKFIKR